MVNDPASLIIRMSYAAVTRVMQVVYVYICFARGLSHNNDEREKRLSRSSESHEKYTKGLQRIGSGSKVRVKQENAKRKSGETREAKAKRKNSIEIGGAGAKKWGTM